MSFVVAMRSGSAHTGPGRSSGPVVSNFPRYVLDLRLRGVRQRRQPACVKRGRVEYLDAGYRGELVPENIVEGRADAENVDS